MLAATAIGPTARIARMTWALSRMADIAVQARVRRPGRRRAFWTASAEIWPRRRHECEPSAVLAAVFRSDFTLGGDVSDGAGTLRVWGSRSSAVRPSRKTAAKTA